MAKRKEFSKTRPVTVWTESALEELAQDLLTYVKQHEDCFFIRAFCTSRSILNQDLNELLTASTKLRFSYKLARQILADRFHVAALTGKINVTYALRIAHFIDDDLAQFELEFQKEATKAKLEGLAESKKLDQPIQIIVKD